MGTWCNGRPITKRQLTSKLRDFGIFAKPIRISGCVQKGFERAQFEDAWRRYLRREPERGEPVDAVFPRETPHPSVTRLQSNEFSVLGVTKGVTEENPVGYTVTNAEGRADRGPVTEEANVTEQISSVTSSVT